MLLKYLVNTRNKAQRVVRRNCVPSRIISFLSSDESTSPRSYKQLCIGSVAATVTGDNCQSHLCIAISRIIMKSICATSTSSRHFSLLGLFLPPPPSTVCSVSSLPLVDSSLPEPAAKVARSPASRRKQPRKRFREMFENWRLVARVTRSTKCVRARLCRSFVRSLARSICKLAP